MKNEKVLLWVDDERDPKEFLGELFESFDWAIICTRYDSAMNSLTEFKDVITHIHLDNDIGEHKEGRDIFNTIESMVFFEELPALEEIVIHTSNPAAAESMMLAKQSLADMGVKLIRVNY